MSDKDGEAFDIWWNRFYDEHKETPTSFESWQAGQSEAKALVRELMKALIMMRYATGKMGCVDSVDAANKAFIIGMADKALAALPAEYRKD